MSEGHTTEHERFFLEILKCKCDKPVIVFDNRRDEIGVTEDNPLATHKEFKPGHIIKGKITCTRCMQIITFTKHESTPLPERLY